MPLYKIEALNGDCVWGIWEISESLNALEEQLNENAFDRTHLATITHEGKKLESLAVRLLAQQLLAHWQLAYQGIVKDIWDKPHLASYPFQISVSHTYRYAVVIIHRYQKVGIDIEFIKEKINKVAPKFLSSKELAEAGNETETLCVYWCAKEVLYKKYGKKCLSLKDEIDIEAFNKHIPGKLYGKINREDYPETSCIHYIKFFDCILAYSYE